MLAYETSGSRDFVVLRTHSHTEAWLLIHIQTTPDFSACPSFEVLRQENPLVLCCANRTMGFLISSRIWHILMRLLGPSPLRSDGVCAHGPTLVWAACGWSRVTQCATTNSLLVDCCAGDNRQGRDVGMVGVTLPL